jgi:predicted ATPase/DNA-binding CsgD family transcriptional regulator
MARPAQRTGNLPADATSFIGRRRELDDVKRKLTQARLVSLVGPGGVGKTRLAIRVATELQRGFPGGGWLVELADVLQPALVSSAVMTALDLRDQAATAPLTLLLSYLRNKELLLVVDNCEHLLGAAAQIVTDIMKAAPGVRIIATSREPLSAPGEHVVPVPPLSLPSQHADGPLAALRQNEAVMLFTERAAAASGRFDLNAANQVAVADLCRRLDGLPLAIELAAVRMRVLTVEQILDRLSDRFGLLTGGSRAALPRHQTLRTTIEWSHDLLSDAERAILRRTCVFGGRFTISDVESVCTDAGAPASGALDLLSSLVDKSLVTRDDAPGLACYRLHETMREFAVLQLRQMDEQEAVELRCADYFSSRCQQAAVQGRHRLLEWLEWADLEIDNIRAVLQRCVASADTERGIDLAVGLGWYWITRATTEGIRWLDEFLSSGDGDPAVRGWASFIRGFLAVLKADPEAARPVLRTAIALAREAAQPDLLAEALSMASIADRMAGDRTSGRQLLDQAQATAAGLDYPPGRLAVLQARTLNGFFDADLEVVRACASEGARLARADGDLYAMEIMLLNLGSAALLAGDLGGSQPLLAEALRIAHQIDDRVAQFYLLDAFGCRAALTGQARLAARLLGAAQTVRTEAGADVMPFLAPLVAKAREQAAAALSGPRFGTEFTAGQGLGRGAAIRLALGEPAASTATPGKADPGPLGARQADVARLVADGLTNKQIGARLFISERTVDSHVRSILTKLGFSSRAQIAAWLASPDP